MAEWDAERELTPVFSRTKSSEDDFVPPPTQPFRKRLQKNPDKKKKAQSTAESGDDIISSPVSSPKGKIVPKDKDMVNVEQELLDSDYVQLFQ